MKHIVRKLKVERPRKRVHINITISPQAAEEIDREMERLNIKSRSRLIDQIIFTYSKLPIEKNTNQSPKTKFGGSGGIKA